MVKLKRGKNAAPFFFSLSPTLSQPSKRLGEGNQDHPRNLIIELPASLTKEDKIMKKISTIAIVIGTLSLLMAAVGWAQPGMGAGGGLPLVHYGTMWEAKTVETLSGEVVAVDKYVPGRGGTSYGVRLSLKTEKETIPVVLGPVWYIEEQRIKFAANDKIEVKGSKLSIQGQPTIIAQEVKKGDQVLKLRDDKGAPLWTGPR
jgi:hypothetical protein